MITEERIQKLPDWIGRTVRFLRKIRVPGILVYVVISLLATLWFLVRVIPKPSRATYPCMQVAAPVMSGFVIWLMAVAGATFAFKKAKLKFLQAKYMAAALFVILGIVAINLYTLDSECKNKVNRFKNLV